ncbi:MAG: DMT family transporter [Alphaproteobacteria bacterium]|nr:DMT family transporter [Alphaproteobacteria bacterium]
MQAAETINPRKGMALQVLAFLCFATMDACAKTLAGELPVLEILWGRYVFGLVFLAPIVWRMPFRQVVATERLALQITRTLLLVVVTGAIFTAVAHIPLADATAIAFVSPLLLTALSVAILGERVGVRSWSAVLVGFVGVLIIIRPGLSVTHWATFMPLLSALAMALYQIATRSLSRTDSSTTTLFYTAIGGVVVTSLVVPFFWVTPTPFAWAMMFVMGFFGIVSHVFLIGAFVLAPASVLAPFAYAQLVGASFFGFILFGHLPDGLTLLGATIIVASGLYVWYREGRVKAAAGQNAG